MDCRGKFFNDRRSERKFMAAAVGNDQFVLAGLLVLNGALYSLLLFALVRGRRTRQVKADNIADAFQALEGALKSAGVGLPPGFTWEEAVAYLRSRGMQVDRFRDTLASYEAYRYGGRPLPETDYGEVLRLTSLLSGGSRVGR